MSSKFDLARAVAEAEPGSEGFAHALNLLVLAIRRTNPSVGPLLDEFTSMHADYLVQLRELPPDSPEHARVLADFQHAARQIYRRLSELQAERAPVAHAGAGMPQRMLH
jgi:ATP/maltotriose-dependent transcriptional regulator MalT